MLTTLADKRRRYIRQLSVYLNPPDEVTIVFFVDKVTIKKKQHKRENKK
jgi:hypothetical protein